MKSHHSGCMHCVPGTMWGTRRGGSVSSQRGCRRAPQMVGWSKFIWRETRGPKRAHRSSYMETQLETDGIFVDPKSLLRSHLGFVSITLNQRLNFWITILKGKY